MAETLAPLKAERCYHCGESCPDSRIVLEEKAFCCEGCKMVYGILNEHALCQYYDLNQNPGLNQRQVVRKEKFAFLEDAGIEAKLISFRNDQEIHITFTLPQMHCSSCLYLLENLHRIEPGVISCRVNFGRKQASIVYSPTLPLRKLAETLTAIGYEPYISLQHLKAEKAPVNRQLVFQLGVAGFCFGNIMLMSFPEYLGIEAGDGILRTAFRWGNLLLSLPVLLYSALPFYISSWKSLQHRFLNIDTPIVLAILITFIRSAWEVLSDTGGGYFDSLSGIVFFMLAGRWLQDRTYSQLSFERDYAAYFPIAVGVLKDGKEIPTALPEVKPNDTLVIHHGELIPADGILISGQAFIDYSFVTGESLPIRKEIGELVYAGGKQTQGRLEVLVIKEVSQSYLTQLWNRDDLGNTEEKPVSFVHLISRYFTYIVLAIASLTALYWQWNDPSRIWPAVTAVFIIACPCALLLANSFTNGNMLSILGKNNCYLRNAQVIENLAATTHIVFDKTGTLTAPLEQDIHFEGLSLRYAEQQLLASLAAASSHPLSKSIVQWLNIAERLPCTEFQEIKGSGIRGMIDNQQVRLGSRHFVTGNSEPETDTRVHLSINQVYKGYFTFSNHYRSEIQQLIEKLKPGFGLSVLSGDNEGETARLRSMFGDGATLVFRQGPEDKLNYIQSLQARGEKVMMIGDGLNDAGALRQSDTGIAITESSNNFTPASDAILFAGKLPRLDAIISLCRSNKKIVAASFVLSILYNVIGLSFAVQGTLSPVIAAILMPSSSLSIVLLTFGSSKLIARWKNL